MSATIKCNFPGCTATFENYDDFHKHIEENNHKDTIHVVVHNLAYAVKLEELSKEFEPFHPRQVRIATQKSGRSKGFALAFFENEEDRTKAIEALNGKELAGRKIRVSIPHRRPRLTAYIGKFKEAPTEEALKGAFPDLKIESVEIVADKLFAYVTFATEEELNKALELKTVLEANIEVRKGRRRAPRRAPKKDAAAAGEVPEKSEKPRRARKPKKEAAAAAAPAGETPVPAFVKNTVHVGKLPGDVAKEELIAQLKDLFASLNPTSVKVVIRKSSRRAPFAFGVVAFATEEEYAKALEVKKLGETEIVVDPKKATPRRKPRAANAARAPRAPRAPAKTLKDTLFVGRLPSIITLEGIQEIFDGCNFKEAKILEGRNSKYGVVTFANEEDAQKALDTVKGTMVEGKEIIVEFKRDTPAPEKKN